MAATELDAGDAALAEGIFGTSDTDLIEARLRCWIAAQGLGQPAIEAMEFSIGAGLTLALADGHWLFVKVWPESTSLSALTAQIAVQQVLHERSYPAPAVLAGPSAMGESIAVAMPFLRPGEPVDARKPQVRRAMAEALARLVGEASGMNTIPGLPRLALPTLERLWPKPHNVLFDFGATRQGAEWIDAVAADALLQLQFPAGRIVVGHNDWSAKNMRWADGKIAIVYDWDSVFLGAETLFLGTAAANFTMSWDIAGPLTPDRAQMSAFIRDYEAVRSAPFSEAELRKIEAAVTYTRAYTARCEHAEDAEWTGSSRETLRRDGPFRITLPPQPPA